VNASVETDSEDQRFVLRQILRDLSTSSFPTLSAPLDLQLNVSAERIARMIGSRVFIETDVVSCRNFKSVESAFTICHKHSSRDLLGFVASRFFLSCSRQSRALLYGA
jgi:hypothetical protein